MKRVSDIGPECSEPFDGLQWLVRRSLQERGNVF